MVIDEEMCNILSFVRNGMEVTAEKLMVESIHKVGHSPNHHLGQPYTREFLKSGQGYWPKISFRGTYGDWKRRGKDEVQLARDRMRLLLDERALDGERRLDADEPRDAVVDVVEAVLQAVLVDQGGRLEVLLPRLRV